jgi:hypothetical protein
MDKRISKIKDGNNLRITSWAVILPNRIESEGYWYFNTREQAERFVQGLDRGYTPFHANYLAFNPEEK